MAESLAAALAELQADLPRIGRTSTAQVGTRRYNYASYDKIIAKVRPVLAKHGFMWHTLPTIVTQNGEIRFVLLYALTHVPTGERFTGEYPLTEGQAQTQGSQISYAKRYALVAVLDLQVVGEDDDGQPPEPSRTAEAHAPRAQGAQHPREAYRGAEARMRVTGPDHERLRYGTIEATPDDHPAERFSTAPPVDDVWTDQPPGNFDIGIPEDRPGSIDDRQMKLLQIAFKDAGVTDRDVRLGMASDMIGRQVLTAKQLSRLEAEHIIKTLKEQKQ